MKKEVILVPKDKCPLDVLAEMGERTKNCWIFLHQNVIKKLERTCDSWESSREGYVDYIFEETDESPRTTITIKEISGNYWSRVCYIAAEDICFKHQSFDPEDIFFLKMEE